MRTAILLSLVAVSLDAQVIRTNAGFKSQTVPRNDDGSSDLTPLGFTINFFGKLRNSAYVNNNGNLTFDAPLSTYTPFGLQKTSREIIAPFFADVDTRGPKGALVSYGQDTVNGRRAFGANFISVGYYNVHDDKLNRFQVVVIDRSDTGAGNFTIEFNYENVAWETGDASGGVNGFGGVPATVGWSNGTTDPGTSFELPGSLISGSFLNSGPRALIRAHLNTSQIGRLLFQARDGLISPGLQVKGGPLLPDGTVGETYSFGFTATGVDTAIKWDAVPDLLMPPGLTFSNGRIAGRPTAAGTYTLTVSASALVEGETVTVYQRATVVIGIPKITIRTDCPVPSATVGQLYTTSFTTQGTTPVVWSVGDLYSLPSGISLSPAGVLTGAPAVSGTFNFLVRASSTDGSAGAPAPAEKSCTMTVNPSTVRLVSGCSMPDATVGVPYAQTLVPDGGVGPYRFTLNGQMPLGLGLTSDGRISGLPQVSQYATFDVEVSDSRSNTIRQSCAISINDPSVRITTACPLPRATTGASYSMGLTATGGVGPYTWSVAGTLPPGLAISQGRITGAAMATGPYTFRLIATDSTGQQTGVPCSLPVTYGPLGVTGCPLVEATVGASYRAVLRPAGGSQPFTWGLASGALPTGLQLSPTGVVDGTVSAAGDFVFGVGLRDNSLLSIVQTCSMKVRPLALQLSTTGEAPAGSIGQAYSTRFLAAGGNPPYRFAFFGYLPDGLTGSTDGTLTGTPTKAGTMSFGIRVTDSAGAIAESVSSIMVGVPSVPAVSIAALPSTVPAASADVKIGVVLDKAYSLPITGQVVLSAVPDTQNLAANANQPDPRVRLANGQLGMGFTIPAGSKRVDLALLSTGTVATTFTVSVQGLRAGGVDLAAPVVPQVFKVRAVAPVITSACYVQTDFGTQITVLGSSTTRELVSGEVGAATVAARTTDLSSASADYFGSDGTIRFGGAFSLVFDADRALKDAVGPFKVRLANTVGWTPVVVAQKCQ